MTARVRTALLAVVVVVAVAVLVAGWLAGALALLATGTGAALVFALVMDECERNPVPEHWSQMTDDLSRLATELDAEAEHPAYAPGAHLPDAARRDAYWDAAGRLRLILAAATLDPDHREEAAA